MTSSTDIGLPIAIALIGLGGSVVVAFTTLFGIRLTIRGELSRLQQQRTMERERWLTELKLSSYADFIQAADDFRKAATDLRQADQEDELQRAARFEDQSHLLDRTASRVNLLGSTAMQGPLHALVIHGFTSISNILEGKADSSEQAWQEALGHYYGLYDNFIIVARKDLGLEPLPRPVDLAQPATASP
jgi:hypothetical protein